VTDRYRSEPPLVVPEDDGYDHDLDDPEFYHYREETEDPEDGDAYEEYEPDEWED
jgi:hypothetical protein